MARLLLHETKFWFVALAENQYYLGRSFIIAKGNARSLSELSREEFIDLKRVIDDMEGALRKTFGATYFNWTCLMNDAYEADPLKVRKELHLHLWPRYEKMVKFDGLVYVDETFGDYYDKSKAKILPEASLQVIKKEITKNLRQ